MAATHDLNGALQRMRAKNIHLTPHRYALLEFLYTQTGGTSVKEICEALRAKYPAITAMTVNSNLHVFEKLGLVNELALRGSSNSVRYEAAIGS
ncbi:transcriptional repressor [Paenibacillus whitsoniae]|nr:transcriptional repressor [Paenibacillus whitsoniae]